MCISGQVGVVSRIRIIHRQPTLITPYRQYSYWVNEQFKLLLRSMALTTHWVIYERGGDFTKLTTQIFQIISIFPFRKLQISSNH